MSLNWNAEKVPAEIRHQHTGLLEAAVWATIPIGIPSITKGTLVEATIRTKMWEDVNGAFCYSSTGEPLYLWQHLYLFVGLYTNASRKTRVQFHKEIAACLEESAAMDVSRARGTADVAFTADEPVAA